MSMNESEKFFKALNEGRVILVPPTKAFQRSDGTYGGTFTSSDEEYYDGSARRVVVLPEGSVGG